MAPSGGRAPGAEDRVLLHVEGAVAEMRINRPERLNAVDDAMLETFARHLETIAGLEDVRLVLLTGAGRAFCAGGDLKRPPRTGPESDQVALLRRQAATVEALASLPQPTIAVLGGACAGLAVGWAAACTLRVMTDNAVVNTAYMAAGLSGDFGVAWWLTRLLGSGTAADWMLRPRKIGAEECTARGFATIRCAPERLDETVDDLTATLLSHKPAALTGALINLRLAPGMGLAPYLDQESERHVAVRQSGLTRRTP
ncbi:enoyl-CoA hydratase/isomerase family protein [Streptomyces sp. NPDC006527]|uniref:enoyl-CoA hydratase/isomerase family protein n=1 Tax=Streptomyces sp. NPDC006527 TaxID=3364749 RepID=UPI0036A33CAD